MKKIVFSIGLLFIWICSINAQANEEWASLLRKGNEQYKTGNFEEASKIYADALMFKTGKDITNYNQGNALYKQNQYDAAINGYKSAFEQSSNYDDKGNALYNMGNAYYQKEDYNAAIKSYKDALKYKPSDKDILDNLTKAKLKKAEQQKQEQQNQDQKNNKDQQNKDQNQDKDQDNNQDQKNQNKDQQKDKNQQQNQDQDQQNQQNQNQQDQEQQGQKKNLTKDELERLLKMIEGEEKNVQKKLTQYKTGSSGQTTKDW